MKQKKLVRIVASVGVVAIVLAALLPALSAF
jgi:hypothetical protein